jgi:predicted metal-dependent peptidase
MARPAAKAGAGEQIDQELGRAIVTLLLKEPFYGHLLGSINRRIGSQVPTAAVALTPLGAELIINPDFFLKELKTQERVAVIKHEALHLVFRHLYRPLIQNGHPELFNLAADLVVNQHIAPWPLPETAITLKTFPDLGLIPDQTLEVYYEQLLALLRQVEAGKTGKSPRSAQALKDLLGSTRHSDHRYWAASGGYGFKDGPGEGAFADQAIAPTLGEALRKALETDAERQLLRARDRSGPKHWGTLPANIRTQLEQVQSRYQPAVDWRRALRLFAASGYRTRVVPTKRRMSKRFDQFPGLRIRRQQRIAIVVDTSGSIDQHSLSLFFAEIHSIWKTGAELLILECDAEVQASYPYQGKPPSAVQGGGGTDFDPAFRWLRQREHGHFDACIYLTDGYAASPELHPPCPLLWVLTPGISDTSHLRGRAVFLNG